MGTDIVLPPIKWWPLLELVKARPNVSGARGAARESLQGYSNGETPKHGGWNGANWTAAMQMMEYGWHEGAKAVDAIMANMPEAEALADAWNLEASGRFPCVPAFLSGDPECMWQTSEMESTKPRICLVVSACYNCGISSDAVLRYGAAVGATLRALEAAGHGVAVYTVDKRYSWTTRRCVSQAVVVRDFGEPLDTSVVAFAFHPAFLRRVLFANSELNKTWAESGLAANGYGQAREVALVDAVASLGEFPAAPVVLSGVETCARLGALRPGAEGKLLDIFKTEVQKALAII